MKYILGQLLQVSAWIGIAVILCALFAPRWFIILLGTILFFTHDDKLKGWVSKNAPGISEWINKRIADMTL